MLIDAHAHLDGYDDLGPAALDAALEEIAQHRIFTISNSMDLTSYGRNLEIARAIPQDCLLTETDNPGGPESYLGQPGTPALLIEIVRSLAEVRKMPAGDLVLAIRSNLANLFQGDGRLAGFLNRIMSEK